MIDYDKVLYADMQKTGSSYVVAFLRKHLALQELDSSKRHAPLRREIGPDVFCFMSVRDPVDMYISLYRFGSDSKGGLFDRINNAGVALYDGSVGGFERWIDFVLDPANAAIVSAAYSRMSPGSFGLMTFRYLNLAIPRPERRLRKIEDRDSLRNIVSQYSLVKTHVRTETLSEDLQRLCGADLKPFLRNEAEALEWLKRGEKINVSGSPAFRRHDLSSDILDKIKQREWFLYDALAYQPA